MTSRCRLPLYAVLDVGRDADAEEIRDAYRQTVKEYHPDVFDHEDAQDLFVWANRAKDVLTDETDRKRYDRVGHARFVEGEGWTSSACPASRTAAVYWPGNSGRNDDESDGADASDTTGRDSGGRSSGRDRTSRQHADAGAGSTAAGTETAGTTVGTTASDSTGAGTRTSATGSTARGTTTESTRGTAQSTGGAAGAAGFADATQRGRSKAAGGTAEWSRESFTTQRGMGSHYDAEELYFRNIGQVDTDWGGGSGLGSLLVPFVGVGFSLVVLFGTFALILYAL